MLNKKIWICAVILLLTAATAAALNDTEQLGKNIFFDKKLSINTDFRQPFMFHKKLTIFIPNPLE